ncbi:MAG: hypothetical protein RH942_09380 [Kiloniellaceae bacterium]
MTGNEAVQESSMLAQRLDVEVVLQAEAECRRKRRCQAGLARCAGTSARLRPDIGTTSFRTSA